MGGGKEQPKPRDRLKGRGWDRICRKMKRCCQGELGAQGTPAASGDSGCCLTSVSANKQLRLIGDVALAAIPARMVLAFVLAKMQGC